LCSSDCFRMALWVTVILSMLVVSFVGSQIDGEVDELSPDSNSLEEDSAPPLPSLKRAYPCSDQTVKSDRCSSELECEKLGSECLNCHCGLDCQYGRESIAVCEVPQKIQCSGIRRFQRSFTCAYCYQSDESLHYCEENVNCDSVADPYHRHHLANCSVDSSLICLGKRHFHKQKNCNWTGGHRWLTALLLSITLGGFGADRYFYRIIKFCLLIYALIFLQILPRPLARRYWKVIQLWWPGSVDTRGRGYGGYPICRTSRWLDVHLVSQINISNIYLCIP
jgi:hypothetical protein